MSKRLTSLLLFIISVSMLVLPVCAEEAPTVAVSSATAKTGEKFEVYITLTGNTDFADLSIEIDYDSKALDLVGVSRNTNFSAICTTAESLAVVPYNFTWNNYNIGGCDFNGTLATLTFRVLTETSGTYPINVDFYKGIYGTYTDGKSVNFNANKEPLNLEYSSGKVTVTSENKLDVNLNGNTISLSSEHEVSGIVVTAFYDSSERLLSLKSYPAATEINATETNSSASFAKVMWWEGYANPVPVCDVQTVILN
ncbi:MAG: hypothetical protein E7412_07130 [Ruminococcaceae bacterium]|nr:hypothetical protein [Oscillospiraceae bacterium]